MKLAGSQGSSNPVSERGGSKGFRASQGCGVVKQAPSSSSSSQRARRHADIKHVGGTGVGAFVVVKRCAHDDMTATRDCDSSYRYGEAEVVTRDTIEGLSLAVWVASGATAETAATLGAKNRVAAKDAVTTHSV